MLVLIGEDDLGAPPSQGKEFYHPLREGERYSKDVGVFEGVARVEASRVSVEAMIDWFGKFVR